MTVPAAVRDGLAVRFVGALAGADGERDFVLERLDPDGLLLILRSVRTPSLRFVLTCADGLFGGYHPVVTNSVMDRLNDHDLDVYVVLTAGPTLTANLRAPICVARSSGRARQVLLDDETLPMRHPLTAP